MFLEVYCFWSKTALSCIHRPKLPTFVLGKLLLYLVGKLLSGENHYLLFQLIDRCFDPESAYGDTGNDNMTAIVVKFVKKKPNLKRSASASPTPHGSKMSKTEESPDTTAA